MPRIVLGGLAAAILLLVPAVAQGDSTARLNGTVALKSVPNHLVTVRATRRAVALRVPGSLSTIRVGQRVELRGSTLRSTPGAVVLGRNVRVVRSQALNSTAASKQDADDEAEDDEVELKGKLTSLSPVTVESASRTVSCSVPAGMSLAGFTVGDVVEMTCDLKAGAFVLRKLEREDDEAPVPNADDDDDDNSGPGNVNENDDDNSGPGNANDDDDDDNSGPGSSDDDDNSGPGGGGDD